VLSKPFDFRELEQMVVSVINRGNDIVELESGRLEPGISTAKR
jgi:hypothetical protein